VPSGGGEALGARGGGGSDVTSIPPLYTRRRVAPSGEGRGCSGMVGDGRGRRGVPRGEEGWRRRARARATEEAAARQGYTDTLGIGEGAT
jgi:hypothetical protein